MTTVEITKAKIIKSIQNEPVLEPNGWVRFINAKTLAGVAKSIKENPKTTACSACAVGGVLRNVLSPKTTYNRFQMVISACIDDIVGVDCYGSYGPPTRKEIERDALEALNAGFPMNAMSIVFEGFAQRHQDKGDRRAGNLARQPTINFVKKHFPAKIQIDIDGAKPAKDVKVVKAKKRVRRGER